MFCHIRYFSLNLRLLLPKGTLLVGKVGLEPTRSCDRRILSPLRLPIPPLARPNKIKSFRPITIIRPLIYSSYECPGWYCLIPSPRKIFFRITHFLSIIWRRGPDSHRCTRFCRPLPSYSATAPRDILHNRY